MGRPTKYNDEIQRKAEEYLNGGYEVEEVIPTIEGLSLYLEITRPTVYDWASQEDKADFSYIVETVLGKQAQKLINGSLRGDLNPTITKLLLTKHDYSDKQVSEIGGVGGKPIDQEIRLIVVDP